MTRPIRLWGRIPDTNFLAPACFAVDENNPDGFIDKLNSIEYGWIVCWDPVNPNKQTPDELVTMAREIVEFSGTRFLKVGTHPVTGVTTWLSQNFDQYGHRIRFDLANIGTVKKPVKPPKTEAQEAYEALKKIEEDKPRTVPPAIANLASKFNGAPMIPHPLLKQIERWYNVTQENNQYRIEPK